MRLILILGLTLGLVIHLGQSAVEAGRENSPERVVTEFLDAIRDRDIDRALGMMSIHSHNDFGTYFVPDAIGGDWSFEGVHEVDSNGTSTDVYVTFVFDGVTGSGTLEVREDEQGLYIENPIVNAPFQSAPLNYIRINDLVVESPSSPLGIPLLPGVYDLNGSGERVAVFPGTEISEEQTTPPIDLDDYTEAAQAAVNTALDGCRTAADMTLSGICPFGQYAVAWPEPFEFDVADVEWTVTDYPVLGLEPGDSGYSGFSAATEESGTVRVTGTVLIQDGDTESRVRRNFTVDCPFELGGPDLVINADNEVELIGGMTSYPPTADEAETCEVIE